MTSYPYKKTRGAPMPAIKPMRWTRAQWWAICRKAREVGKHPTVFVREAALAAAGVPK